MNNAFVHIVGAGPGDPDLLTVKAARLITNADVVVYDKLVSQEVLELISPHSKSIYVGKARGHDQLPQAEINHLLVELCVQYQSVVRLKGGDPLVFDRGGEEALALRDNDIPFQFVPGITVASACSTYAGIPLTYCGLADSVKFISGHRPPLLDSDGLKDPSCTLVFSMCISNQQEIVAQLIKAGRPSSTPAAIIEKGTTRQQRRIVSTLQNLVSASDAQNIGTPAILVVGDVVSLAHKLSWFRNIGNGMDKSA